MSFIETTIEAGLHISDNNRGMLFLCAEKFGDRQCQHNIKGKVRSSEYIPQEIR